MKYFSLAELTYSTTAARLHIDNTPPLECSKRLILMTELLLDPLRELWGGPLLVSSGYRCVELNKAIGGASGSQHCLGKAADLQVATGGYRGNMRLYELLKGSSLPYDQIIAEQTSSDGLACKWVHVSWSERPRKMYLVD